MNEKQFLKKVDNLASIVSKSLGVPLRRFYKATGYRPIITLHDNDAVIVELRSETVTNRSSGIRTMIGIGLGKIKKKKQERA